MATISSAPLDIGSASTTSADHLSGLQLHPRPAPCPLAWADPTL